ncbi:MAG: GTP-binding protein [Gammaproteobacteria bacterium]|nr:GTP-binding protein [Gammaproteobacteria bacterium]
MKNNLIPVTVLTGFLGAGKTTLLNRILNEQHSNKILVIENEFGEAGIDNALLAESIKEQIVVMNNGCICCTVRGDLVKILGEFREKLQNKELDFNRVIIETTGLADPAPVAQTFFMEPSIESFYKLDAVVTVVDAVHGSMQLDEHHEAQEQVGFADRILISKTDLVEAVAYETLQQRLRSINQRASIKKVHFGETDINEILDVNGFNLDDILKIEPGFLEEDHHEHDDNIKSFVIREKRPYVLDRLEMVMSMLVQQFGNDMLRYKGILNIENNPKKLVFQGVHMIMGGHEFSLWPKNAERESVMVFIGRDLPERAIRNLLDGCVAI